LYACHIWHHWCEIPSLHIDGIWVSLHKCVDCLGHHQLTNLQRFGGMVDSIMDQTCSIDIEMETIMFHCEWWFVRVTNIIMGFTMFCYIFIIYTCLHLVRNGCHYVLELFLKKLISMCNLGLCGIKIMSWYSFVLDMCWKHGGYSSWKKLKVWNKIFYTLSCSCPSNLEKWLNLSRHIGARWWTPLIALSLTIHGLHVFGFTIANLISNQPTFLCLPISMGLWM